MKRVIVLLILALISLKVSSQNEEFIYTNSEFGVEIKFPAKPTISFNKASGIVHFEQTIAKLSLLSAGLTYYVSLESTSVNASDMVKTYKENYGDNASVKSQYEIGGKKTAEIFTCGSL